ncbi:MAG: hypothetical protein AAFR68_04140 [Pseudomonadota bacterium]
MPANALLVRTLPNAATPIQTTVQSSVTYDGETYTLDAPAPVGFFEDGRPFIVSNMSGQITNTTSNYSASTGNGMMKNPGDVRANGGQGWDPFIATWTAKESYEIDYNNDNNVDPGATDAATWSAGESATFVKAFRHPNATNAAAYFQAILKYHFITILPEAPPEGTVCPGPAGTTKVLRSVNDVNFTPRGYTLPSSWPPVATIIGRIPDDFGLWAGGETRRRLRLDFDTGGSNDGYSAELMEWYGMFIYALNSADATQAQRDEMITKIIRFSNHVESWIDNGININSGAGQGGLIWMMVMSAAALLNDDALHQKLRGKSQVDTPFWIDNTYVGLPAPGNIGISAQTYFDVHVGLPHIQPDEVSSAISARYVNIASYIVSWEVMAVCGFNQGSGSFNNGAEMVLNGANDNTNPYAAVLARPAMHATWNIDIRSNPYTVLENTWRDAWAQVIAFGDFTPWTGPPEQPPTGNENAFWEDPYFSVGSGAGEVAFDDQDANWSTLPRTRVDMRYSLDNIQFVEISDVTLTNGEYTIGGLLRGVAHYVGWRQHNSAGESAWSPNYPYRLPYSGTPRALITTTGSEANAAPVNTVAPAIHRRRYPGWNYEIWEPAAASLGFNDVSLAAGVGYWSGFPAPDIDTDFSFQWRRDTVDIPGATSQKYSRVRDDAETNLDCRVRCNNGQGGNVDVITPAVACPALQVLPAGTLIDTDFRDAFLIDYLDEFNSITLNNSTLSYQPAGQPTGLGENFGVLGMRQTGTFPNLEMTLSNLAQPNTTYEVLVELPIEGGGSSGANDMQFRVREAATNNDLYSLDLDGQLVEDAPDTLYLWQPGVGTFTTGSTNLELQIRLAWPQNTGGSQADIYMSRLRIREV